MTAFLIDFRGCIGVPSFEISTFYNF